MLYFDAYFQSKSMIENNFLFHEMNELKTLNVKTLFNLYQIQKPFLQYGDPAKWHFLYVTAKIWIYDVCPAKSSKYAMPPTDVHGVAFVVKIKQQRRSPSNTATKRHTVDWEQATESLAVIAADHLTA